MVHLHDNREQNMLSVIYSYFEVLKCGNSVQKRPNDSRRRMCSHKIITLCWQPGFLHKIITSLHIWIFYCRLLSRENIFVHMWQLFCYFHVQTNYYQASTRWLYCGNVCVSICTEMILHFILCLTKFSFCARNYLVGKGLTISVVEE